ncbi:MAG TPA: 50S ribosomal protein L4 [Dehalococcoidia bacterium]|nr:50S ribosomal protein L4 [Dehalococcoidia bacterium]
MELPVVDRTGTSVGTIEVADEVFGLAPNRSVLHQTFVAQMANRRQGTVETKTRGQVRGSTVKIRRQKGLGAARQGSIRAPHRTGGGIVFGPHKRDFSKSLPKRMRRLAIRSALSSKARDGELVIVDELTMATPKTKDIVALLEALDVRGSTIIATGQPDENVKRSAANLERVRVMPAAYLNVADMMNHRHLILTKDAVRAAESLWGGERANLRRAPLAGGTR